MRDMNTPDLSLHSYEPTQLRIAMVTETYPPEVNGVAITIGHMVRGLRRRGHHIQLVRPRQHEQDVAAREDDYEEVLVKGMPIPGYPELRAGAPARKTLLQLWTQQRPDVIQIATEGPLGWSAMAAANKLGIPVCSDFHTNFHSYTGHYGIGLLKKPIAAYLRYFHNKTQCTMVPTASLQSELQQDGYKEVKVVSRGVDTTLFHPSKRSIGLRAQWGAADDTPVAILVSRLAPEKNLPVVIQAFHAMREANPDILLVMVGDGPSRAELQQQHPEVIFAGMRTGEDLAAHYASADIFLYPSLTETYGNVTVESMSSGLATLAYDYAAANQHIRHDANGLTVPFDDTAAFIAHAKALATDPERVKRIRIAARETVESPTWDDVMGDLEAVLLRLARSKELQHVETELATAAD